MSREESTLSPMLMRVLGLLLILIGLLIVAVALTPGEGEGIIILFPFAFRVSGRLAIILSTLLFIVFTASMILIPWYLISRGMEEGEELWTPLRRRRETTEYIITLEVPRRLRKTLYVEVGEEGEIYLRSTKDPTFERRYTLPAGFDVEDVEFDYEGDYLILRLLLRRKPQT